MTHDTPIISGQIDISKVRGLLFDVDGTLSDTDDHLIERIAKRLKPVAWLHKEGDTRHIARSFVMAIETPANFFYGLADRMHLDRPFSKVYERLTHKRHIKTPAHERFWIVPGVDKMLAYFWEKLPMGVVSARDERTTMHFLEHFDLLKYFEVVVTAQTCIHTKPFPDPVVYAARQMGLEPEHCVMIGDTTVDVRAGRAAGAQTIGVLCGFGSQRELEGAGADLIVETTGDIQLLFANKAG
ncbi:MAG: HAD family hydrolase [Brevefilum sp.]